VELRKIENVEWGKVSTILLRYFAHGIAFSILFLILGFIWAFVFVFLMFIGFIIGFIIGIVLLFLIIGYLNSAITSYLWFPVETSFWGTLFHGLALFIVLLIAQVIVTWIPNLVVPGIFTQISTFIIGTFVNGILCKNVAKYWKTGFV
jgi:hypothetical protein